MIDQFAELAGKKVTVEKRPLTGAQTEAFAAAVRQDDAHLLAVPVSLPSPGFPSFPSFPPLCLKQQSFDVCMLLRPVACCSTRQHEHAGNAVSATQLPFRLLCDVMLHAVSAVGCK